jgi:hypothetical protein
MHTTDAQQSEDTPPARDGVRHRGGVVDVLSAWCLLVLVDVLLRVGGFNRLCTIIRQSPTIGTVPGGIRTAVTQEICASVNSALAFYFRRAWCLQAAAAAVFLLRLHGIRGELVIGVRRVPFYAHAWVDVDGEVVLNARTGLKTLYREILRG